MRENLVVFFTLNTVSVPLESFSLPGKGRGGAEHGGERMRGRWTRAVADARARGLAALVAVMRERLPWCSRRARTAQPRTSRKSPRQRYSASRHRRTFLLKERIGED